MAIKLIEQRIDFFNKERDDASKKLMHGKAHADDMISIGLTLAKSIIEKEFKQLK